MTVCRDLLKGHKLRKQEEDVTNSTTFQRVLELMLNLCTLGGSERVICPGMRHTACATRRSYSYTSVYCALYDLRGALGLWCLCRTGTSTALSRNLAKELDVIGHVDEEHWAFVVWTLLPQRRIGVIGVVPSRIGMSVPVDDRRLRAKRIGSCVALGWFPGPPM